MKFAISTICIYVWLGRGRQNVTSWNAIRTTVRRKHCKIVALVEKTNLQSNYNHNIKIKFEIRSNDNKRIKNVQAVCRKHHF